MGAPVLLIGIVVLAVLGLVVAVVVSLAVMSGSKRRERD
jgi:hypothetical protein